MTERISALRKNLNMTQETFGNRLGVRKTAISKLEKGENNLTEQMIKLICSEFSVSEDWLRTGEGNMFVETDESILSELSTKYKLDSLDMKIVQSYLNLATEQRSFIKDYVTALANSINEDSKNELSEEDQKEIDEEVEAYRQKLIGTKNINSVS